MDLLHVGNLVFMSESPETPAAVNAPDEQPLADESAGTAALDLDAIEHDLAGVEVALARLDAGTYWVDEVTGEPLPAALLAASPTARRAE